MRQDNLIEACARAAFEADAAYCAANLTFASAPFGWGDINGAWRGNVVSATVRVLSGKRPGLLAETDPCSVERSEMFAAVVKAVAAACGFDFKAGLAVAGAG